MKKDGEKSNIRLSSGNQDQSSSIVSESSKSVSKELDKIALQKIYDGNSSQSPLKKLQRQIGHLRKRSFSESKQKTNEPSIPELPSLLSLQQVFFGENTLQLRIGKKSSPPKKTTETIISKNPKKKRKSTKKCSGVTIPTSQKITVKNKLDVQTKRKLFRKRKALWNNLGNKDTTLKHLLSNIDMEEIGEKEKVRIQKRKLKKSYLTKNKLAKHVFKKITYFSGSDSKEDEKILNIPKSFILGVDNVLEKGSVSRESEALSPSLDAPPNSISNIKTKKIPFREKKIWKKAKERLINSNKKKRRRNEENTNSNSLGCINLKGKYEIIDFSFKNIKEKTRKNSSD
jgi:hypothetical protein